MSIPVTYDQAIKAHALDQYTGQHGLHTMHFFAMKTIVRGHHRLYTRRDGRGVACRVNVTQFGFCGEIITLVLSVLGAAVSHEMLGGRDDTVVIEKLITAILALQSFDKPGCISSHNLWVF